MKSIWVINILALAGAAAAGYYFFVRKSKSIWEIGDVVTGRDPETGPEKIRIVGKDWRNNVSYEGKTYTGWFYHAQLMRRPSTTHVIPEAALSQAVAAV